MNMPVVQQNHPSLENLVESGELDLAILHPGGLELTLELAQLCRIEEGTSVLDVACGTGESACYLAEHTGARVVGIDISGRLIEKARRKAEQRNLQLEFRQADAHQLPFVDAAFDCAISECSVCLMDKERALAEMARVVKPGGYVGIDDVCWQPETPERIKERLAVIEGERPETLAGWKTLFERAGLVAVTTVGKSSVLSTWIKGTRKELGLAGQLKLFLKIFRKWGLRGVKDILESEWIFEGKYLGYGIIVGRKPTSD
jgi:arsenite methyltransferase